MLAKSFKIAIAVSLTSWLAACAGTEQKGSKNGTNKKAAGEDEGDGKDGSEDEGSGDAQSGNSSGANAVFATWCKKADETAIIKDKLQDFYERMCDNGKPSALLTGDLVKNAYSGSGTPAIKKLENIAHDVDGKNTTSAILGIGIKIPVTIKTHFDKVGPRGGDVEALADLAKAQGATGESEILETFKNDGKYHVRGWKIKGKNEKDIKITKIITETISRSDQYELESGKAYMYTQYVIKGIQGIKKFDLLTAGVRVGNDNYLLTVAQVVADNKGIKAAAEQQIMDTAKGTVKAMYKAAQDAGGD